MKFLIIAVLLVASLQAEVRHFMDLREGVNSFILAIEEKDKKTLNELFSSRYQEVLEVQDLNDTKVQEFLNAYDTVNHLVSFDGKSVYLQVGAAEWIFPVPLVKDKKGWYFDLSIGMENINDRRKTKELTKDKK